MKPEVTTDFQTGRAQIFKNPILERLTKTDPISNVIVYGLVNAFLIYLAIVIKSLSILQFIGLFVLGLLFWTFTEYMLHRFVFHWITEAKWSQRFHFILHGAHHNFPTDKERLLMPPVPGVIIASLLFGMFFIVFWMSGYTQLVYGFFPGFFIGYLMYSFVHRATHVMRPPKRFKDLWHHHSLHHYKYPNKAFGVSNTFWDKVFGTMPPKKKKKKA